MKNSRLKNIMVVVILLTSISAFGSYADIYCESSSLGGGGFAITSIGGEGCVVLDFPITNSQGTVYVYDRYSLNSIGKMGNYGGIACSIDPSVSALVLPAAPLTILHHAFYNATALEKLVLRNPYSFLTPTTPTTYFDAMRDHNHAIMQGFCL